MEEEQQLNQTNSEQNHAETIINWLISYLSELLEIEAEIIDISVPFERYGLDSSAMIVLSGDLQTWLGCNLEPTILYDHPTIGSLALYLEKKLKNET